MAGGSPVPSTRRRLPPPPCPLPPQAGGEGKFLWRERTGTAKLPHRLVQPLVIESAFERVQLLPEFLGVRGHNARIEGFAVAPALEQGEVVGAAVLLQHVEPQIPV